MIGNTALLGAGDSHACKRRTLTRLKSGVSATTCSSTTWSKSPYLMLRDSTMNNDRDAPGEAALLGKAWGLAPHWIVRDVTQTAHYFTGLRCMHAAYDALDDLLNNWE